MTVYIVRSATLRAKGEKLQFSDPARAAARLKEVQRTLDPKAKLLTINTSAR